MLLLATNWRAPAKLMLSCRRWRGSGWGKEGKESAGRPEDPQFCHELNAVLVYFYRGRQSTCLSSSWQFSPSLLQSSPSSFSFLGDLPSSVGGLDCWLCLARLRLNTCLHICRLFSQMEVLCGSLMGRAQVASSSPRLGREAGENVR